MNKIKMITLTAFALSLSGMSSVALAGNTAGKLTGAGYTCFAAGPSNWTHCLRLRHLGNPAIPVKVLSVDGTEFLGTELLLRADIYYGQPCPQDGLDAWSYNADLDYFACHHFDTGHHQD